MGKKRLAVGSQKTFYIISIGLSLIVLTFWIFLFQSIIALNSLISILLIIFACVVQCIGSIFYTQNQKYILNKQEIKELIDTEVEERKLQKGPRIFYYLDEKLITSLHSQITRGIFQKEIEMTKHKENKKSVSGTIVGIGGNVEISGSSDIKEKFEVNRGLESNFNEVEKFLEENKWMILKLETYQVNTEEIDEIFKVLTEQYGVSPTTKEAFLRDFQKKNADEYLEKITHAKGFIWIQAKFLVIESKKKQFILSFTHPISKPLEREIKFTLIAYDDYITRMGLNIFKTGKEIDISFMGKVLCWNSEANSLQIAPIAIY